MKIWKKKQLKKPIWKSNMSRICVCMSTVLVHVCVSLSFVVWCPQCESRAIADLWSTERPLCVSMRPIGHFCTLGSPSSPGRPPDPRTRAGLASLQSIPDKEPLHSADSSLNSPRPPLSQTGLQQSSQPLMLTSIPSIDPNEIFPTNAWFPIQLCNLLLSLRTVAINELFGMCCYTFTPLFFLGNSWNHMYLFEVFVWEFRLFPAEKI